MWEGTKLGNSWWWACGIRHDIFSGCVYGHGHTPFVQFNSPVLHKACSVIYINWLSCRWYCHWQLCHNGTSPHIVWETTPSHDLPLKVEIDRKRHSYPSVESSKHLTHSISVKYLISPFICSSLNTLSPYIHHLKERQIHFASLLMDSM